jgi:hypothetical protein
VYIVNRFSLPPQFIGMCTGPVIAAVSLCHRRFLRRRYAAPPSPQINASACNVSHWALLFLPPSPSSAPALTMKRSLLPCRSSEPLQWVGASFTTASRHRFSRHQAQLLSFCRCFAAKCCISCSCAVCAFAVSFAITTSRVVTAPLGRCSCRSLSSAARSLFLSSLVSCLSSLVSLPSCVSRVLLTDCLVALLLHTSPVADCVRVASFVTYVSTNIPSTLLFPRV